MNWSRLRQHSLKTRVTLDVLTIFLVSIWSLSFYVGIQLQGDLQRQLSKQQFSTVSLIASEVHRSVNERSAIVESLAQRLGRNGGVDGPSADADVALLDQCYATPLAGGIPRRAATTMLRDAADHPSPNGGWCEAAWAGALGVRLGGANTYGDRVEVRGTLGNPDWPHPSAGDVRQAARLVTAVTAAATALAATTAALVTRRTR